MKPSSLPTSAEGTGREASQEVVLTDWPSIVARAHKLLGCSSSTCSYHLVWPRVQEEHSPTIPVRNGETVTELQSRNERNKSPLDQKNPTQAMVMEQGGGIAGKQILDLFSNSPMKENDSGIGISNRKGTKISSASWKGEKGMIAGNSEDGKAETGVRIGCSLTEVGSSRGGCADDGDLVLATVNLPSKHVNDPYYKIVTAGDSNSSSPGFQLVFNESGYLFVLRENEERSVLTPTITGSAKDLYYRATLDFDGVFTLYSHPKASTGNDTWTSLWSEPEKICTSTPVVYAVSTRTRGPSCGCPRGYALVDPSNQYGNCKPNFTLSCEEEPGPVEDLYEFEVLTNVVWPLGDYALLEPFTEDQCRQSCLHDCMCAVAIYREGDKCWKKRQPLTNGRPVPSHFGAKAFLKVRKGDRPPFCPYFPNQEIKNQETLILALSVLLGMSVFFIFILVTATCLGFYFIYQKRLKLLPKNEVAVETNLRTFTYKELENATNEFKEELGRGSFGIVYKGTLPTSYVSQPQNILLDEHYNAKISDFGLAKLLLVNQSHTNTAIRGTKGYVAAEWFRNLPITVKTATAEGALDALVENDIDALNDIGKVEKFVQVAIWCIQEDPSLRPTMRAVSQMLEGVLEIPFPPCPCPYPYHML
ncbi:hypothetical protein GOBAR_DD26636 [Gossypium barbadense]|nr:hypothetical protein GOBAR_DD26636 [Gossypium barbadense]